MRSVVNLVGASLLIALAPGCNMLIPASAVGQHRKKVTAEFDKLRNTRTAILVWADPATRFDYPHVQFELSSQIAADLSAHLNEDKSRIDLVDTRDVADFLQKEPGASNNPLRVGRQFKADYVVFVEVVRFQMRDPDSPELLRPNIEANVSVHDVRSEPERAARVELSMAQAQYDEGRPVLLTATSAHRVREEVYQVFGETVARKFYDHTIDLAEEH